MQPPEREKIVHFTLAGKYQGEHEPTYATPGSAGADLYAAHQFQIHSNSRVIHDTGVSVAVPEGFELQIRPRSGLAFKQGITVLNSPGTIDSDFRGTIQLILINHGYLAYFVACGDRIAQAVLSPVYRARYISVPLGELPATERGEGGLGSTGTGAETPLGELPSRINERPKLKVGRPKGVKKNKPKPPV